ncbi:hypothetical protein [Streptomyces sp. NPDC056169]|uniref:hypothetical protein n=1 Tax=Streptomyces sp. NPDC056169 TaxID=3345734 RepID=UPI0035D9E075
MSNSTWRRGLIARVDNAYDEEYGSGRSGRLATYLRDHRDRMFEEDRDNQSRVLVWAWDVATSPVMSPGYVRLRPDLFSLRLGREEWDGTLFAEARFPLPHHQLQGRVPYKMTDWATDGLAGDPFAGLYEPSVSDSSAYGTFFLAEGRLRVPVTAKFPHVSAEAPVAEVKEALLEVVLYLNDELAPRVDAALGIPGASWPS